MTSLADYRESRELLTHLTLRELRGKYKRSTLGWAWSLLNPLSTMLIFTIVFRVFFRAEAPEGSPSGLSSFALFLLCGLLPWNFLTNSVFGSLGTVIGNASLIRKTYFPRELLVVSQVASWIVSFLLELSLLAVILLIVGNMVLPLVPVVLALVVVLALFATGLSLALSVFNVFFRDVQHFVGIFFQAWFYLSPIVYSVDLVPERHAIFGTDVPLRAIYKWNPMAAFAEAFRDCLYHLRLPSLSTFAYLVTIAVATFLLGLFIFGRFEGRLAEEL
ncbi:MAG: ABC transporter permease [Actinobacteria bacterium]|nr:ABC transporter permease [Actinomycetota bacterium]MBW3650852.1 ABC transporter permease [Actinomycetota bacterium]